MLKISRVQPKVAIGLFGLILLTLKIFGSDFNCAHQHVKSSSFTVQRNMKNNLQSRREMHDIDCKGILEGNRESVGYATQVLKNMTTTKKSRFILSDEVVAGWAHNCQSFITSRQYVTSPINDEEAQFPIAYSINIYKDLQSFETLLRSIYRPQNIYCIHVDQKALAEFQTGVENIIGCFDNVFLASRMTKAWYSHWTVVQASLNCMEDLVKINNENPWKYAINLCGQDLPVKTNLEIVRGLKSLGGKNSLPSSTLEKGDKKIERFEFIHLHPMNLSNSNHQKVAKTTKRKDPPPHNIQVFKGMDHFLFSRKAIEFMLTDSTIKDFFEWNKDTKAPDEHMWATLQRIFPRFPGSEPPNKQYDKHVSQTLTEIRIWESGPDAKCSGKFVRKTCVHGLEELQWIVNQKQFFANKFMPSVNIFAINCLAEWLQNRSISEHD